jgi:hypothetical protein
MILPIPSKMASKRVASGCRAVTRKSAHRNGSKTGRRSVMRYTMQVNATPTKPRNAIRRWKRSVASSAEGAMAN